MSYFIRRIMETITFDNATVKKSSLTNFRSRGVPRERCSENMQQIYRRSPMWKCDFNKVAAYFHNAFS